MYIFTGNFDLQIKCLLDKCKVFFSLQHNKKLNKYFWKQKHNKTFYVHGRIKNVEFIKKVRKSNILI